MIFIKLAVNLRDMNSEPNLPKEELTAKSDYSDSNTPTNSETSAIEPISKGVMEKQNNQSKKSKDLRLFIKNDLLGGYSLAVRDNWGFKTLRRHINEKEKLLYEQTFGNKMITDDQFFSWWCQINGYKAIGIEKEFNILLNSQDFKAESNFDNESDYF